MSNLVTTNLAPKKGNNTAYTIHCIIGIVVMFGLGMLEPFEPVTPVGMQVLGIFLGCIYLWSFAGILWPSLLGIVALGISDYAPMGTVIKTAFGDTVPVLVLFAMILFGAIQHAGITKYISRWFLTRKIINGKPVMFSFIFIYCAYVIAALSANILPALLLMWSILYGVLDTVGYKKGDKYTTLMVIGTMFGAISGQAAKPFTGSALMVVGAFEKVANQPMEYLPYMTFGLIMSTLGIIVYSLLIKFVFRPDMSKIANINTEHFEKDALPKMDLRQKILFGCLFGYLGLILLPSILPKTIGFVALLNTMGPLGTVIAFVVALCMFKIDGRPIMDFKEIVGRYVTWDVYCLVAMAMAVSGALTADATGIKDFLVQVLQPVLGGHTPTVFLSVILVISLIITNFANNAVMGVLLMPIVYGFGLENGANLPAIATAMTFLLHYAIVLPAASPYAAILHGNKDWIEPKDAMIYGLVICFSMLILFLVVAAPVANFLF